MRKRKTGYPSNSSTSPATTNTPPSASKPINNFLFMPRILQSYSQIRVSLRLSHILPKLRERYERLAGEYTQQHTALILPPHEELATGPFHVNKRSVHFSLAEINASCSPSSCSFLRYAIPIDHHKAPHISPPLRPFGHCERQTRNLEERGKSPLLNPLASGREDFKRHRAAHYSRRTK